MTVTFFGTYNTKTTPRIQVLIDGLRAHKVTVQECNDPLRVSTAGRVKVLSKPWLLPLFAASILRCWISLVFKARRTPPADAVLVGHLGQFDIHLARWLFRGKPLILDYMISGSGTANDRKLNSGLKNRLLVWLDNSALRLADIIMVDTEEHRQGLPDMYRHKGVVVHVGAPQNWFEATAKPQPQARATGDPPLRVVFFGLYTPLQGTPAIGAALKQLKQPADVTMIGQGQDFEEAKQATKGKRDSTAITWLDWVDAADLPKTVAAHDVCLGIFGTGPKALNVVPNKVYQGAAASCAIITSDTVPQRRVLGQAALFVPPDDPAALAKALDGLAKNRSTLANMRQKAHGHALNNFTPPKIVQPLLEKLDLPV